MGFLVLILFGVVVFTLDAYMIEKVKDSALSSNKKLLINVSITTFFIILSLSTVSYSQYIIN